MHFIKSLAALAFLLALGLGQASAAATEGETKPSSETIVLAGGCFWGVEAVFEHVQGVTRAVSSYYTGGQAATATYEQVSSGTTGHAEAVEVTYDPNRINLAKLLEIYFTIAHDPTELNRQGPDHGTQYRSAIFTTTSVQQQAAGEYVRKLGGSLDKPVVTTVSNLDQFYPAETYHQDYLRQHPFTPYIIINDAPKVAALHAKYPGIYKD